MARRGRWSLLRRRGTPAGGLALLCVVLALPAQAATPAPDPPPGAVAPEPPPAARTQPAPVRSAPVVVAPAPVVHRAAPVVRAQPPVAKPKAVVKKEAVAKAKPKATGRPLPGRTVVGAIPHDRARLPLGVLEAADELDRSLLAVAGALLLVITLSGGTVLWAGRRALREGLV